MNLQEQHFLIDIDNTVTRYRKEASASGATLFPAGGPRSDDSPRMGTGSRGKSLVRECEQCPAVGLQRAVEAFLDSVGGGFRADDAPS